jgi:hypothetical protein
MQGMVPFKLTCLFIWNNKESFSEIGWEVVELYLTEVGVVEILGKSECLQVVIEVIEEKFWYMTKMWPKV